MGLFSYVDNKGYKRRKSDGKPIHRIIAEKMNGGPLKKGAVVHHKNRNKRDNSLGNLQIIGSQKMHGLFHKWNAFWFGKKSSYRGGRKEVGDGFVLLALGALFFLLRSSRKKQSIPNAANDIKSYDLSNENM